MHFGVFMSKHINSQKILKSYFIINPCMNNVCMLFNHQILALILECSKIRVLNLAVDTDLSVFIFHQVMIIYRTLYNINY